MHVILFGFRVSIEKVGKPTMFGAPKIQGKFKLPEFLQVIVMIGLLTFVQNLVITMAYEHMTAGWKVISMLTFGLVFLSIYAFRRQSVFMGVIVSLGIFIGILAWNEVSPNPIAKAALRPAATCLVGTVDTFEMLRTYTDNLRETLVEKARALDSVESKKGRKK